MKDLEPYKPREMQVGELENSLAANFVGVLEAHHITPERLAKNLSEELDATLKKPQYNSSTKEWDLIDCGPDWKTKQEARRDSIKLLNLMPQQGKQEKNMTVNLFMQIVEASDPCK